MRTFWVRLVASSIRELGRLSGSKEASRVTATHSFRLRRSNVLFIAGTLAAAAGGTAALVVASASPGAAGSPCDRVPLAKCHVDPSTLPVTPPSDTPGPAPFFPSPEPVICGADFFDASTVAELTGKFGSLTCFKFSGGTRWVVAGDGMNPLSAGPSSVGAMIAVENCAGAADASCVDPNAAHDFARFTVSYPPDPTVSPVRIEATFGGRLLSVVDGPCGLFNFAIDSMTWFGHSMNAIAQIMNGSSAQSFAAAPAESGATALARTGHPALGECEQ